VRLGNNGGMSGGEEEKKMIFPPKNVPAPIYE
jgi:hypothetical protein